ncbi:MAG TPA: hypothetical protein EYH55_01670 [Methanothermococcus okinawensis]|uniref:Uncharacterized protein n=1 Tax=Methanothermococcus okinawensis TaxID=155863 RepID=A0A832ZXX8_9EURY|nr:hypothetical protein [Methanothermococcus okinawensis]
MHYSTLELKLERERIVIDKGSLKTKRKFAFLLEEGDVLLRNRDKLQVHEEVEVVVHYTSTQEGKRPKETVEIYRIVEIVRR